MTEETSASAPSDYSCESCGQPVPSEKAYAPMETLDLLCDFCLRERVKPCEECGKLIFASAYQHLPTGRVLCEPCVVSYLATVPAAPLGG